MKIFLINEALPDTVEIYLCRFGKTVRLQRSGFIPLPVGAHPDTLIGKLGKNLFVSESETEIMSALDKNGIPYITSSHLPGGKYPADCALNFIAVKDILCAKLTAISKDVLRYAEADGYKMLNVAQGYTKCSTLVLGGGIITADGGIHSTMVSSGLASLKIEAGHVSLPPYEYGFIGGASGTVGENAVFFGSLEDHPNKDEIRSFCKKLGYSPVEFDFELTDFGGFIEVDI